MNECEEVTSDATCLGCDDALSGDRGNGSINGIAAALESPPRGLGARMVGRCYRALAQGIFKSGSSLFRASSTARITALLSSSST